MSKPPSDKIIDSPDKNQSSTLRKGEKRPLNDFQNFQDAFTLYCDHDTSSTDNADQSDQEQPQHQSGFIDQDTFMSKYQSYQILYLPQLFNRQHRKLLKDASCFTWKDMSSLFTKLNEKDKSSWTEENCGIDFGCSNNKNEKEEKTEPGSFLFTNNNNTDAMKDEKNNGETSYHPQRGYCSFIVQHDRDAMKELFSSLPLIHLPIVDADPKNGNSDNAQNPKLTSKTKEGKEGDESNKNETAITNNHQSIMKMKYGPCIWFFYGRNDANLQNQFSSQEQQNHHHQQQQPLEGRPEHTDYISHDGTWHYQLSGIKEWHLKPTEDLLKQMEVDDSISKEELDFWKNENDNNVDVGNDNDSSNRKSSSSSGSTRRKVTIKCQEGDVILVNTRLWWHSTTIPQQPLESNIHINNNNNHHRDKEEEEEDVPLRSIPSVSYARDIYLQTNNKGETNVIDENTTTNDDIIISNDNMTNIDGLYASNDIEVGTIIFTENDMPDCELHRSKTNANCEVVELDDGSGAAVVSCRDIKAGEFFCLLESDDDDDDDDDDEIFEEDEEVCVEVDD